jgi:hypothetical protein
MKKLFFAALMITGVQFANAQVNKGQWLAGGNVSFESMKQGDWKVTTFDFSPNVGFFVANKFAVGLRPTIMFEDDNQFEDAGTLIGAGPFLRYYFLPSAQKLNIFADADAIFGTTGRSEKNGFNQFDISAGPALFLTPHTALEFALQYKSAGGDAYGDDRRNSFGVKIGFQVHLGGK